MLVAQNPYDSSSSAKPAEKPLADANNNSASSPVESIIANSPMPVPSTATVWVEPPARRFRTSNPSIWNRGGDVACSRT